MVNLLLIVLMIAALAGMILCGRFRRRRPTLQLIALLLLLLVLVAGLMFMSRTGALSVLGLADEENTGDDSVRKLARARAYVLAHHLAAVYPEQKKILLVGRSGIRERSAELIRELALLGKTDVAVEELVPVDTDGNDKLITADAEYAAEGSAIDAAIQRHPEAQIVILSGITPTGESIARLKIYRLIEERRPKIVVLGLSKISAWVAEQIERGIFSVIVVTDLTKAADFISQPVSDNPVEAFNSRYVLITRDNLKRNRRFFR